MSRDGKRPEGDKKKVTRADLEAKLIEIESELNETGEAVKPKALAVGIGALVVVLILAFLLGRRKGERKTTIVEVRRL